MFVRIVLLAAWLVSCAAFLPGGQSGSCDACGEAFQSGASLIQARHATGVNRSGSVGPSVPSVQLALFLNNIERVDSHKSRCLADVVIRTKYRKADFGGAAVRAELIDGVVRIRKERRIEEESGNVTVTEHFFVDLLFSGNYDMFPFDVQTVSMVVQLKGLTSGEARLSQWPGESGIRQDHASGSSHFKAEQFHPTSWAFGIHEHLEHGMPYNKSRGELRITLSREASYYWATYVMIPSLTVIFSILSFVLPGSMTMPRVAMSFSSFLGMFVHLKQMLTVTPGGTQSWIATNAIFFCAILFASMLSSLFSASVQGKDDRIAEMHDAFVMAVLLCELLLGQVLLLLPPVRPFHRPIGLAFVFFVLALHTATLARFTRRLDSTEGLAAGFNGGLGLVCPCCASRLQTKDDLRPPRLRLPSEASAACGDAGAAAGAGARDVEGDGAVVTVSLSASSLRAQGDGDDVVQASREGAGGAHAGDEGDGGRSRD